MAFGGRRRVEDPAKRRGAKNLSLSQSLRELIEAEARRRDMSEGRLAEQWLRAGAALDPALAHLSAEASTNRAS